MNGMMCLLSDMSWTAPSIFTTKLFTAKSQQIDESYVANEMAEALVLLAPFGQEGELKPGVRSHTFASLPPRLTIRETSLASRS
eukprot:750476-Hanusia_phi.AAC.1